MTPAPTNPPEPPAPGVPPRYLEIDTSRKRRWAGLTAYILFFLLIAVAIVFVFIRFAGSLSMAILLVAFMVGYMLIMGYLAGKNVDNRDP